MASNSFKVKNSLNLTPQASEPSGLEVGDLWADLNGKIYRYDGSGSKEIGSSQGGINYITNPDFESNDAGWVEYLDAAGVNPVDATGGSPNVNFQFTRNTTNPLFGAADGQITKDAVNRQGHGVSLDTLTIDLGMQSKVMEFSFDYKTSTPYNDGDIRCGFYDVTNSVVLESSQRDLLANTKNGKYLGFIQIPANCTQIRPFWHISSTNGSSYTVNIDNVRVGPAQAIESGNVVSFNAVKTANQTGVNPNLSYVKITFPSTDGQQGSGYDTTNSEFVAPESGTYFFNSAIGISSTNILANQYGLAFYKNGTVAKLGQVTYAAAGVTFYVAESAMLYLNKGDKVDVRLFGAGNNSINTLTVFSGGSSTYFSGFKIASDQASAGSSVVAFRAFLSSAANHTVNGAYQKVPINSVEFDTSGAWDISNTRWNCPESGYYNMLGQVTFSSVTAGKEIISAIRVNNTAVAVGNIFATGATTFAVSTASCIKFLNKGDYVELFAYQNDSTSEAYATGAPSTSFSISKLSSPAIIPPTEFVGCNYESNSGQAVVSGNTFIYEDRIYDSNNFYDIATGVATVPVTGKYLVTARGTTASIAASLGNTFLIRLVKNGTDIIDGNLEVCENTAARNYTSMFAYTLDCNKGDLLRVDFSESLPAVNMTTLTRFNKLSITKVG